MAQILLADDVPEVRMTLRLVLESAGHSVVEVEEGLAAVAILEQDQSRFALVITDVLMPNGDGIEVTKRTHQLCPNAKVLVISGGDRNVPAAASITMASMFGADAVLYKPFTNEEFLDTVDRLLTHA